ncbi:Vanillin dehydrogenase [Fulvia fulva]|uniref:Vanillin dehydrogenase n=1 Tax=Passalora fulva TaxID=5499 RepID=A0A9Q8LFB5_PASFU|nr:Vanillin dehydrogenase [Fulvia fulva]KAK4626488.1 Vanillin dehydrogenase [Fulvia fulva]KAK4628265.1 Vanillin dehydrogenase [Fulvia fulva]UJO16354.1 Vanillin dehydrogenase [Fulvia fulva]WPV14070.1 Vanillin dehydrogenase [Fulvia fulva]WPV28510.1 Vanillin dehydrogenase [Fulvia fulva]
MKSRVTLEEHIEEQAKSGYYNDCKMGTQANGTFSGPVPLWIDGKEVTTSTTFDVDSPTNSQKLWTSSSASVKEAQQACEAAQKAFKPWSKTKPGKIWQILTKAADILEARKEEAAKYMMEETGALRPFADFNITTTIDNLRDVAGRPADIHGIIPPTKADGQAALVFKEPYGAILGIAPWNAPYILGVRAFLPALAAGNTIVLKGSELSPRTYWIIGSIFKEAGLPDGVLNIVYHRPADAADVTNALIEHPAIKKVNFTGSTGVGSIIASKAGKELKPVLMELGGKASAIVCEDANIEHSAFQCALGAFMHAGQICMSTERIIVNRKIQDKFAEALKGATEKIYSSKGESPVLVAKPGVEKNHKLRTDAVSKGATVLYGDAQEQDIAHYRIRPTIITDVKKDMDIFYTESFGPTVSLIPVDTDEGAIDLANDTEYGLSGAIFTENLGRGLKIAKEIDSGAIHINSMSVHDEYSLPHGGVKKSGWGRFNGKWGMEEFLKLKTVSYIES